MSTDLARFYKAGAILAARSCGHRFLVNPCERLARFVERSDSATRKRLNAVTNLAERQSGEARSARSGQVGRNARVNGRRAVSGCTHECGQGLAKAVRHFAGHVLDGVVNRGSERQGREVRVIGVLQIVFRSSEFPLNHSHSLL